MNMHSIAQIARELHGAPLTCAIKTKPRATLRVQIWRQIFVRLSHTLHHIPNNNSQIVSFTQPRPI